MSFPQTRHQTALLLGWLSARHLTGHLPVFPAHSGARPLFPSAAVKQRRRRFLCVCDLLRFPAKLNAACNVFDVFLP